jgi:hypothetical protein
MEHTTQESVERTIFSKVHEKRYTLAGEAPICNRELFQDFGYCANTPASRAVLDGTYTAPLTSGKATRDLFAEIAAIHRLIPANSVPISSLQSSGNNTGRSLMKKHHPLSLASILDIISWAPCPTSYPTIMHPMCR